ncbi:MAG TPA: DUF4124 domain-containing protein [Moraxellaceae bacterium]
MRKSGLVLGLLGMMGGLGMSATAQAGQIYQCEENGRKVFSQQPCGSDAKVVKSANADRTVVMAVNMSLSDVNYLCALAMRSWEKRTADQRNSSAGGYYGGSSRDAEGERQAFVLSHIENLETIAADDPELYEVAKNISRRTFYGRSGDYTYDAERARAEKDCRTDVNHSIDRLAERRKAEDDLRYGRKKVK